MTRVYLVRHGSHPLLGRALAGRMAGVSLSDEGRAEAERLAVYFASREIGTILTSPMERCRETAQPTADRLALPVAIEPALHELDCGEWTGASFEALAKDPRWHKWNSDRAETGMPGGETVQDVQRRIGGLLDRLGRSDQPPLMLVTHSDTIKVAILTVLDAPLGLHDRLVVDTASVTTLDLWPGGGKIVRLNEDAA